MFPPVVSGTSAPLPIRTDTLVSHLDCCTSHPNWPLASGAYPYLIYPLCCDSIILSKKAVLLAILLCLDSSVPYDLAYAPQWGTQGPRDWAPPCSSCLPSPHLLTHLRSGHGKQRESLRCARYVSPTCPSHRLVPGPEITSGPTVPSLQSPLFHLTNSLLLHFKTLL